jgi:hypothetical protein
MNKSDAINALKKTHRYHKWDGPIIGDNSINDFVMGTGAYAPADEISGAIRDAVSNRIASALSSAPGNPDDAWKAWRKGEIGVDFSDIQEIIDDID